MSEQSNVKKNENGLSKFEPQKDHPAESDDEKDVDIPEGVQEILDDLPADKRKVVKRTAIQMMGVMQRENPLLKKITEKHIDQFLEGSKIQMQEEYKEQHEKKIFLVIVLLIALVFIVALVVLLKDNPDILEKVLYTLGGVITGAFGGYGIGKNARDD